MTPSAEGGSGRAGAILSLAVAFAAVLFTTALLYLVIWENGMWARWDASRFLNGAVNLVHENGISFRVYISPEEGIQPVPVTHSTPLLAIAYAAAMKLGVPYLLAPQVISLIFYVVLLISAGWLTYRLSASWLAAALSVVFVSITESTFFLFASISSETLFLPLLVLSMAVLVDVNQRERGVILRLVAAAILLSLLILSRYVGIVILAGVMAWWFWSRLYQRRFKSLLWELPILGAAVVPFLVWLIPNRQDQRVQALGEHLEESRHTFIDGVLGVLEFTPQIIFPFREHVLNDIAIVQFVWHLPILIIFGCIIWRYIPRESSFFAPHRSPVLLTVGAYISLYTIVQPFMLFYPMNGRDVTTILCLVQPWLFGVFGQIRNRWATVSMCAFVAACVTFIVFRLASSGIFGLISLEPPALRDFSGEPAEVRNQYIDQGAPSGLLPVAPRTNTIQRYNPELAVFLRQFDDLMVISTIPNVLFYTDIDQRPYVKYEAGIENGAYGAWRARGYCYPLLTDTVVIFSEWDYVVRERDPADLERKCPDAAHAMVDNHLVYRLDQTTSDYEQGLAYAEQGEWQRAIDIYDAALAFNPDNVRAYADRGKAYLELQQWEQAITDFDQAIDRMPGWAQPYRLRGEAYAATGNTEQAQADFDKAAALEQAIQESEVGQSDDPPD
jgi:hypothetical protein